MGKAEKRKDTNQITESLKTKKTAERTCVLIPKPSKQTSSLLVRLGFVVLKRVSREFATKEVSKWHALFEVTFSAADLRKKYTEARLPRGWQYQEMDGGPGVAISDERGRLRIYARPEEIVIRPFYSIVLVEKAGQVRGVRRTKLHCIARSAQGDDLEGTSSAIVDDPLDGLQLDWTPSKAKESIGLYGLTLRQIFAQSQKRLDRIRPQCNDLLAYWDELDTKGRA